MPVGSYNRIVDKLANWGVALVSLIGVLVIAIIAVDGKLAGSSLLIATASALVLGVIGFFNLLICFRKPPEQIIPPPPPMITGQVSLPIPPPRKKMLPTEHPPENTEEIGQESKKPS